jgi:carboxylesterase type B
MKEHQVLRPELWYAAVMSSIAQTRHGKVEGVRENGLCVFKGIPYAAPPIGALRWLPPAPPDSWSGVRPARELSVSSFQNTLPDEVLSALDLKAMSVPGEQGEDCLTLNVWTPGVDDARRPVMVWIHGGGFTIGSSAQPIYDGQTLARRGALERAMQDSWIAFARSGDPSNEALGGWPGYGERRETMILGEESHLEYAPYDEERRAWEGLAGTGTF